MRRRFLPGRRNGEDLGPGIARLLWFIMDGGTRGRGMGRRLLSAALDFVDKRQFTETHLWTFAGLSAARHLYEAHGFVSAEERAGTQWGSEALGRSGLQSACGRAPSCTR